LITHHHLHPPTHPNPNPTPPQPHPTHRDFKPQNIILSASSRRLKLIDFGAAADLRLGINYVPNEYLLDPRYAPPQQYIMSRQTPKPPPKPVAALLSPVLWAMEAPDRWVPAVWVCACAVALCVWVALEFAFVRLSTFGCCCLSQQAPLTKVKKLPPTNTHTHTRTHTRTRTRRFDMYSAGITLLQMAFPALRTDNGLIAFNRKLKEVGWDLNKWKASEAMSK